MKRFILLVFLVGSFVSTFTSFAQYAEAPYYDSVTVSFKKRCAAEGMESCLTFLLKDQDKRTRAEIFNRLTDSEKEKIDSYLRAKAEAAEKAAKAEAEAQQRAAELRQRQAEARQQALAHYEKMQALERQRRALNKLRAEMAYAQAEQRLQHLEAEADRHSPPPPPPTYQLRQDGAGNLIMVPR